MGSLYLPKCFDLKYCHQRARGSFFSLNFFNTSSQFMKLYCDKTFWASSSLLEYGSQGANVSEKRSSVLLRLPTLQLNVNLLLLGSSLIHFIADFLPVFCCPSIHFSQTTLFIFIWREERGEGENMELLCSLERVVKMYNVSSSTCIIDGMQLQF